MRNDLGKITIEDSILRKPGKLTDEEYDALVSKRCYKEKMSFEEADKVILESMGSHFDPMMQKYYELARLELEEFYRMENA